MSCADLKKWLYEFCFYVHSSFMVNMLLLIASPLAPSSVQSSALGSRAHWPPEARSVPQSSLFSLSLDAVHQYICFHSFIIKNNIYFIHHVNNHTYRPYIIHHMIHAVVLIKTIARHFWPISVLAGRLVKTASSVSPNTELSLWKHCA